MFVIRSLHDDQIRISASLVHHCLSLFARYLSLSLSLSSFSRFLSAGAPTPGDACACAPADFFSCFYALLVFPFRNIIGGAMHLSSPLAQPPPSPLTPPSDHFLYSNFSLSPFLSRSFSRLIPRYPTSTYSGACHTYPKYEVHDPWRGASRVNGKLDRPQHCLDSIFDNVFNVSHFDLFLLSFQFNSFF